MSPYRNKYNHCSIHSAAYLSKNRDHSESQKTYGPLRKLTHNTFNPFPSTSSSASSTTIPYTTEKEFT